MLTVILAEKPSQARSYVEAFQHSTKHKGYYEIVDPLFGGPTVITYGFGHLVSLAEPVAYGKQYQRWSVDTLPIIPERFKFTVNKEVKSQFEIVKVWLEKADQIIIATDSDREGENIAWSMINFARINQNNKEFKRLWINSLEKEVVRTGFAHLKPAQDYYNFFKEAQTRQLSDWLVGMNLTRLYTCTLQKLGIRNVITIGRVQTPTLYLVYEREKAIQNFKPEEYFDLNVQFKANNENVTGHLEPLKHFSNDAQLEDFLRSHNAQLGTQTGQIIHTEKKLKFTPSPRLYSLSSLQSELNRRQHLSASEVLESAQRLYEAKLLSYPRSDCSFITEAEFTYLKENREHYATLLGLKGINLPQIEPQKRYVNGQKVQEHHAIIPTRQVNPAKLAQLSKNDRMIYAMVVANTLAMFAAPYRYEATKATLQVNDIDFTVSGSVPIESGWHRILGKHDTEQALPQLNDAVQFPVLLTKEKKKTKPLRPFTEGTLITAMKTAGKTLDDETAQAVLKDVEGIGTEATRSGIIEELKRKQYLIVQKNKLHVTSTGQLLCQAVETAPVLTSAQLTAEWEEKLKAIGQGTGEQSLFLNQITSFIGKLVKEIPGTIQTNVQVSNQLREQISEREIGKCPKCHQGEIVDKKKIYGCTKYQANGQGCDFAIFKTIAGRKLKPSELKMLLVQGKTGVLSGFKKKTGEDFKSSLVFNPQTLKIEFARKSKGKTIGTFIVKH